jgi:4-diphosphocytidyl-2-C-methyl-D-erythritol kinase
LRARAKINLALDVVRKREDGYHDLEMIMQTIDLYDKISIKKIVSNKIIIRTNVKGLPVNESNIVYKAAKLLIDKFSISNGVYIYIEKHIPIGSGMAGGSTDAAATLKGMNTLFDLNLSVEELMSLGLTLGADVPYCILGGTALAKGVGEQLTQLEDMKSCFVLIAKPWISVSTKLVFTNLNINDIKVHPDVAGMVEAINDKDYSGVISRLGNVLELVTIAKYPIIGDIKHKLNCLGADGVLMSGSGSTVFGLFTDKAVAHKAYTAMRNDNKAKTVYLTKLYNN